MDPSSLLVLIGGPILALGALIANSIVSANARDVWGEAARELGLELSSNHQLQGQMGGFTVTATRVSGKRGVQARIHINARGRIPASLSLKRESAAPLLRRLTETEIRVGETAFDSLLFVNGDEAMVRAVLDAPCRERVMWTFSQRLEPALSHGILIYAVQSPEETNHLTAGVREGVALAQALSIAETDIVARLVRNIQSSDSPEVRLPGLEVLMRTCKDQGLIHNTLRALLSDPVPRVRIAALMQLGAPVFDRLLELLETEQEPSVRVALLGHVSEFGGQRVWPAIKEALRSKDETLQQAAAKAARATNYTALAPRIARKIMRNVEKGEPQTLISLAEALGTLRDPSTEPTLVSLLKHGSRDVQGAAAAALGEFGSVAAVESLLGCSESMVFGGDTKRAVLNAVGRIQGRLGQVGTGGLSLAETDATAGALSVAVPTPPEGALSALPQDTAKSRRTLS